MSDGSLNLVGTEASGTCVHMAGSSVHDSLDPLHIGLPSTVGTSVGVGDLDTESHALAAIITFRHFLHLLSDADLHKYTFKGLNTIPDLQSKCKSFFQKN